MKKIIQFSLIFVLLALSLIFGIRLYSFKNANDDVSKLVTGEDQLTEKVSNLFTEITDLKNQNLKITNELAQFTSKINSYQTMQRENEKKYEILNRVVEGLPQVSKKMAFVKGIDKTENTYSIELDYVDWFSGEGAKKAVDEDKINADSLNNGFYIRNKQIDEDKVTLNKNTLIYTLNGASTQYIEFDKFVTEISDSNERLFNVLMIDRKVVILEEQYRP